MPTNSKSKAKVRARTKVNAKPGQKKASVKKTSAQPLKVTQKQEPVIWYKKWYRAASARNKAFLDRRPHRSFRRTRRRDYVRPLELPKFLSFSNEVTRTLWQKRRIFLPLMVIYVVLYSVLVGVGSQDTYSQLTEFLKESGGSVFEGGVTTITQSALTLFTLAISGLNTELTDAQQIFAVLLGVMAWLTTVWLLRNTLAGHKVKMRDGLYSAGSPLISSLIIVAVIAVQLLPVALAAVGYSAASASGLIESGGVAVMLFWAVAALFTILSLYWVTSSLFALVIVTLPGMYPYRALKASGDIVLGRRVKILLRWLWMALCVVVIWVVVMLPIILIDMWLKGMWSQIEWLPIVPVALMLVSTFSIFWISTYVYLLYRKVVDNDSE